MNSVQRRQAPTITVAFILGAGVSICAGLPSTQEITRAVLDIQDFADPSISGLIYYVKKEIDDCFRAKHRCYPHETSYEDIYHFLEQIANDQVDEYENPALRPLLQEMTKLHLISEGALCDPSQPRSIEFTVRMAVTLIKGKVLDMVNRSPESLDHLRFLTRADESEEISNVSIFTLNHDCTIESYLRKEGIDFTDGFIEPREKVRIFDAILFEDVLCKRVVYLKLHGSTNWFWVQKGSGEKVFAEVPGERNGDIILGSNWSIPCEQPAMLIGTFNKILDYTQIAMSDIHDAFHKLLRRSNRLVVAGFSFNDKTVNTQIIGWMHSSLDHRMLIVDPNVEKLPSYSRPAIGKKLGSWENEGRLRLIPSGIQSVTWDEMREALV